MHKPIRRIAAPVVALTFTVGACSDDTESTATVADQVAVNAETSEESSTTTTDLTTPAPASAGAAETTDDSSAPPTSDAPTSPPTTDPTASVAATTPVDPGTTAPITTITLREPGAGTPIIGPGSIDPGLQPFIDVAAADLAGRLGISRSVMTVESAVLTTWTDSSLGCPQPRMEYAQMISDGSAIELSAEGQSYWYHSGGTQGPFLCESPLRTTVGS